ncbi:DUF4429 domain-containing protein [Leptolyngbya sp. BC1307]|uniref:DUF4429 domain-containing protein n=1 Tax=Leptolyngbya sp. BC1307 TaxID=2029589 RepID=UPI000EFD5CD0|nr:DUF4429 domain-containing protein [Leptolyngbya sp. BC1307]
MTSQQAPDIVALSKGGNPKAIAALINRQLKTKGIEAKANLKGRCLEILLEAAQAPDQHSAVKLIGNGLTKLSPNGISTVRLFGKETGKDFFSWENSFSIPYSLEDKNLLSPSKLISDNVDKAPIDKKLSLEANKDFPYGVLGKNGQIKLTRKRVIISRKGFWGFLSQGMAGDKEIPINRITAVQFKEVGALTTGFLQFSILGGIESRGGVGNAANDENTVLFEAHQQREFKEVKRYVDSVIDDEAVDFRSLNLPDFETLEERRIEANRLAEAKMRQIPNYSFSPNVVNLTLSGIGAWTIICGLNAIAQ